MNQKQRSIEQRRKTLTAIAEELNGIYKRADWRAATGLNSPPPQFDPREIQPLVDRVNCLFRHAKEILDAYTFSDEPDDLVTENLLAEVMPQILPFAKLARNERKENVQSAVFQRGIGGPADEVLIKSKSSPAIESLPFGKRRAREFVEAAAKAGKPLIAVDYINEDNFKLLPDVEGTFLEHHEEFLEILKVAKAKGVEVLIVRFDVREYFNWLHKNNLQDSPENEKGFRMTLAAPACFQALDREN